MSDSIQVIADLLHPIEGYATVQSAAQNRWLRRAAAIRLIDAYREAEGLPPAERPDEGPRPPDSVMIPWSDVAETAAALEGEKP